MCGIEIVSQILQKKSTQTHQKGNTLECLQVLHCYMSVCPSRNRTPLYIWSALSMLMNSQIALIFVVWFTFFLIHHFHAQKVHHTTIAGRMSVCMYSTTSFEEQLLKVFSMCFK